MSDLARVSALAELLSEQKERVAALEDQLKTAKAAQRRTEEEDLPSLMSEVGLSELRLTNGQRVTLKEECKAALTNNTREAALRWLRENNFGGLIKTNVSIEFGRGEHDQALSATEALSCEYDGVMLAETVHSATLKAFVKEQMAKGAEIPMDLFNVYPYTKAEIK